MNRINLMIDMYATIAAMRFYHAEVFARGGYINQAAEMTDMIDDGMASMPDLPGVEQGAAFSGLDVDVQPMEDDIL